MANVEITRIVDHVSRGVAQLISQFRAQPEVVAHLTAYLNWIQKLEDGIWQIIESRTLEGEGVQLDVIGKLLGLGRGGFDRAGADDESYRAALAIRIRVLRSFGTLKDFEEVLTLLTQLMGGTWRMREKFPMRIVIDLYGVSYDPYLVAEVLIGAKLAGVALELRWTSDPAAFVFRFAYGTTEHSSDAGFNNGTFIHQIV